MLNCLIVEDEPLARQQIQAYISRVPFLRLAGTARNAEVALDIIRSAVIDLVFLDIQLPQLNGIEFLKGLAEPPQVIFITAYPEYAVTGFELEVTDYLVKPVTFERFLKACEKARLKSLNAPAYLYVRNGTRSERVAIADILFVEAMLNYVHIVTASRKLTVYASLTAMESSLPQGQFIKIHKSYLAALRHIDAADGNQLLIGGHSLPISRSRKKMVGQRLNERK